jgi:hypothetical protein
VPGQLHLIIDPFYPRWVNHVMTTFSSPDVMRFLGKHINSNGQLHQDFSGEVVSDFKRRAEGYVSSTASMATP